MEHPASQTTSELKCARCGTTVPAGAPICWLCFAPVGPAAEKGRPPGELRTPIERAGGFSLASLMMFVTLLSVVFGLSTIVPGIGIPLGIVLLVTWGRTVSVSRRRAAKGKPLTSAGKIEAFFSSLGFVFALLLLVIVGACVAFGAICFGLIASAGGGANNGPGEITFFLICAVLFVAALGIILRLAVKWNESNWRRMMGDTDTFNKDKP